MTNEEIKFFSEILTYDPLSRCLVDDLTKEEFFLVVDKITKYTKKIICDF